MALDSYKRQNLYHGCATPLQAETSKLKPRPVATLSPRPHTAVPMMPTMGRISTSGSRRKTVRYSRLALSQCLNPRSLVLRTACPSLWLILVSRMVSFLTLSFLLVGMFYPNSWMRFRSESLCKLTEGFYSAG